MSALSAWPSEWNVVTLLTRHMAARVFFALALVEGPGWSGRRVRWRSPEEVEPSVARSVYPAPGITVSKKWLFGSVLLFQEEKTAALLKEKTATRM